MKNDICDGSVSITDPIALEDWNAMIRAFLAHGSQTPTYLAAVLKREPGFAMGHAARGLFTLMLARRELQDVAAAALKDAETALSQGHSSLREQLWCRALAAWLAGRPSGAVALVEEVLVHNPRDTFSAKLSHAIRFMMGDRHGMRRSVERLLSAHEENHPMRGFLLGCHAFTLEETGEYARAEQAGLEGLSLAPDDAWGLHAVAHVYDMTHQPDRGIALIDDNGGSWLHCNNFRYHVWWHKALLHLDRHETDHVLALYDNEIRHDRTDDFRDFSNASSLLMRLELEGVDVGGRWEELAELAESRSGDACLAFADLHYMLALVRRGRQDAAQAMLARFHRDSAAPETESLRILAEPGLIAAEGLAAYGEGQYGAAFRNLALAQPRMQSVGGSHAQRDVFERITIDAGMRAGYLAETEALIRKRTAKRGGFEDSFAAIRLQQLSAARASMHHVAAP
ncbi:tetratricopeptide repeat protein [Paracoccus sp. Z330]|uniref:Tetratricopeptide repeat protein 38 n=1 Tax=Paracoccus onchidii TaxID=3017813 RepID=A0ABT4ZD82_9RHOB|nr:tetratricopeptide repeat protein [Paracoccus onchidii]MDB6177325.1 tetratricopeptide repeat protein [Paracoccus onchidii]